ncbi:MAG: hypothetical protein V8R14_04405 [Clostridia bacterium]
MRAGQQHQYDGSRLWDTYLHKIVFPDYRVTDQHRSWIGYTLKGVLGQAYWKTRTATRLDFSCSGISGCSDSAK